ncbi:MAG: cell division protein FtsZ [bacterium]|nr:cell division protein FtsZ [bacterium]
MKTVIKVVGLGGAGCNTVDRMVQCKVKGIELIAGNTDVQDLKKIRADVKIQLGKESTRGLGAGMNPEVGKKAAQESAEDLRKALAGADMIFLAAGLGGGTGGGAIPVVAEIAKSLNALCVAVVTTPFSFEGAWRARNAAHALEELRHKVDTLLVIPNDKVVELAAEETSLLDAFWKADEVLRQAVQGISDLIVKPGIINVDFADVKSVMLHGSQAVFGQGVSKGEKRIANALEEALHSPLLTLSIEGAKGLLINISGSKDLRLSEVEEASSIVRRKVSGEAKIIVGAMYDTSLKAGEIRVTVLATGLKSQE